jgi:uncharacterized protein
MQLSGEQLIKADRETVWAALNNPDILKACIEGCQSLTPVGENQLEGVVAAAIGPVKATFKGLVTLSDFNPPESYKISGEGKGGAAGFAKGGAEVKLLEVEGGTLLTYGVTANVGGKLAQIGARLVDAAAQKYAASFFESFKRTVEAPAVAAEETAASAPPVEAVVVAGIPSWAWAGGVLLLTALVMAALLMK